MENYMYENQRWQELISPIFCPQHEPITIPNPHPNDVYHPWYGNRIKRYIGFVFPTIKRRAQA